MNGKILKIASNDLYGNATDRTVSVFAAFNHLKYMNKYVIFSYTDELDKKILHCGSIHLKSNALVIFEVNKEVLPYIDTFVEQYLDNKLDDKEYEIIDLSNISKVELVSSSSFEFEKVHELDNMSIKKEIDINESENGKKKPVFLYFLLFIMIILLIGVTYLYFNPDMFDIPLKELKCDSEMFNNKLDMKYIKELDIKFDKNDRPKTINGIDTYVFLDNDSYQTFKNSDKQNEYFNKKGEYKYNDNLLQLKIFYTEETVIDNYDELFSYLKQEGYTCQESVYNE